MLYHMIPIYDKQGNVLREVKGTAFEGASEERVKRALKDYKNLLKEKEFKEHAGSIIFKDPITFGTMGMVGGLVLSGLVAKTFGLTDTSKLWIGASSNYHKLVELYPELFAILSGEIGLFMGLDRYVRIRGRFVKVDQREKSWEQAEFRNDELIHVLTPENGLDTAYLQEQLYYLNDKAYLPKSAMQYYKENGEEKPLGWTRFKRDGVFELYLGEIYERKGQFNHRPKIIRIPYSGLVTGVSVFGPTGSGKSAAVALPLLDQGIGYYHWVPSERESWMFESMVVINKLTTQLLKETNSSKKESIVRKIAMIRDEALERNANIMAGKEQGLGYCKMLVICVEPKDEIWATQKHLCKQFGREQDYIELGVVAEKYQRYQNTESKLIDSSRVLWSYAPDTLIRNNMLEWMSSFGHQNGIAGRERSTKLWRKAKDGSMELVEATKRSDSGRTVSRPEGSVSISKYEIDLNGVYGNDGSDFQWISDFFARSNIHRKRGWDIKKGLDAGKDLTTNDQLNKIVSAAPVPWMTFGEPNKAEERSVAPFGFGIKRDPWIRLNPDKKKLSAYMQVINGQRSITGTLQRMILLYALISDTPKIKLTNFGGKKEYSVQPGVASLLHWQRWGKTEVITEGKNEIEMEDWERLKQHLDREDIPSVEDACGMVLPVPTIRPNAVMKHRASGTAQESQMSADDLVVQRYKEAMDLSSPERIEAVRLRKRIRAVAFPVQKSGERRYEFRVRYAQWRAERRKRQYDFMEGLVQVLYGQVGDGSDVVLKALERERNGGLPDKVMSKFFEKYPSGMIEATTRYLLHHPELNSAVLAHLKQNGYDYHQAGELDSEDSQKGQAAYDADIHKYLRAQWSLLKQLCLEESIPLKEDDQYQDIQSHLKLRRAEEIHREALVIQALILRTDFGDVGMELGKHVRLLMKEGGLTESELHDLKQIKDVLKWRRDKDKGSNAAYVYDPGVPTIDPITDDPEDFEATIDCEPALIPLGPWDAMWMEGVGDTLWNLMRDEARSAMTKAIGLYGEEESKLQHMVFSGVDMEKFRHEIEGTLRKRREDVFNNCMSYLSAVESYLRSVSPYYKSNTPLNYGFRDHGGIGDCQGSTKFNPLHHPEMTPNQTASMLLGILSKNAGSGDTSFWNDSGIYISDGMISLLRAARSYLTVSDLNQMIVSDAFVDLVMAQGEERIRRMQETAGGNLGIEESRKGLLLEAWKRKFGLSDQEMQAAIAAGEIPMEMEEILPRAASGAEIRDLEGYLNTGKAFITSEWRSGTGSFADKEIRSTCKLNLINQLTPVTQGIGAYSFSPEDPDEISFPIPTEMRNKGLCVATRFNYAVDKKLGAIVIGMFIIAYEMMVLSAKQRQTRAGEAFPRINKMLIERRAQLKMWREELRKLKKNLEVRYASEEKLRGFLKERYYANQECKDPQEKAKRMMDELQEAIQKGVLGGQIGPKNLKAMRFMEGEQRKTTMLLGKGPGAMSELSYLTDYLATEGTRIVNKQEEEQYHIKDKIRELEGKIWAGRQEILNGLSELEEFPDWSRLAMFLVDEYHLFQMNQAKMGTITDTEFLSTARAGKSINVYITQTPSSIKSSGMSLDAWEQWISNTLVRICLGAPNKSDQEYISDLFRGEMVRKEKEASYSLSMEGVDVDQMTGGLRASKVEGGSRNYTVTKEHEKYVAPDDLARMPVMSSWTEYWDGQRRHKPSLIYHPPYFLMTSDKVSPKTHEPLATKSWMALVRDGELNLVPSEDDRMREIFSVMTQVGTETEEEQFLNEMEAERQRGNKALTSGGS